MGMLRRLRRIALITALLIAGSVTTVVVPATVTTAHAACIYTWQPLASNSGGFYVNSYDATVQITAWGRCGQVYYQVYINTNSQFSTLKFVPYYVSLRVWVCGSYRGAYYAPSLASSTTYNYSTLYYAPPFVYGSCGLQADNWDPYYGRNSVIITTDNGWHWVPHLTIS